MPFRGGPPISDETAANHGEVPAPKEQSQKDYREILLNELTTGLAEFKRPFAAFLALTTFGNSLGGVFFVAALKYGHSTRGIDGPIEAQ